jgi:hypothetical protein
LPFTIFNQDNSLRYYISLTCRTICLAAQNPRTQRLWEQSVREFTATYTAHIYKNWVLPISERTDQMYTDL